MDERTARAETVYQALRQEGEVLQKLCGSYTAALGRVETHPDADLAELFDEQNRLMAEADCLALRPETLAATLEALRGMASDVACREWSAKLEDGIMRRRKLLLNLRTLNEKLTYRIGRLRDESQRRLTERKNQKRIQFGYGHPAENYPKSGGLIDLTSG